MIHLNLFLKDGDPGGTWELYKNWTTDDITEMKVCLKTINEGRNTKAHQASNINMSLCMRVYDSICQLFSRLGFDHSEFLELEPKPDCFDEDGMIAVHVTGIDRCTEKVRIQFEICKMYGRDDEKAKLVDYLSGNQIDIYPRLFFRLRFLLDYSNLTSSDLKHFTSSPWTGSDCRNFG